MNRIYDMGGGILLRVPKGKRVCVRLVEKWDGVLAELEKMQGGSGAYVIHRLDLATCPYEVGHLEDLR